VALQIAHSEGDSFFYRQYNTAQGSAIYELAQSFHTSVAFSVSSIKLKIGRMSTPGTCSIGLYNVDGEGHPTGSPIVSIAFNGDLLNGVTGVQLSIASATETSYTHTGTALSDVTGCLFIADSSTGNPSSYNWAKVTSYNAGTKTIYFSGGLAFGGVPTGFARCYPYPYSLPNGWREVILPLSGNVILAADTTYAIRLSGGDTPLQNVFWNVDENGGYGSGNAMWSLDGGASWIDLAGDFIFEIYGKEGPLAVKYRLMRASTTSTQLVYCDLFEADGENNPTGNSLAQDSVVQNLLSTGYQEVRFTFNYNPNPTKKYIAVLSAPNLTSFIRAYVDSGSGYGTTSPILASRYWNGSAWFEVSDYTPYQPVFGKILINEVETYATGIGISAGRSLYGVYKYGNVWGLSLIVNSVRLGTDGQFLVATTNGGVYLSGDFGDTWSKKNPDGQAGTEWIKGICSSNGTYIVVESIDHVIYISTNGGTSWNLITPAGGDTFSINSMVISNNGQYILIVGHNTTTPAKSAYLSSNYGTSWTAIYPASGTIEWGRCNLNGDGKIMIVSSTGNFVYASFDGGTTWEEQEIPSSANQWVAPSISGNGKLAIIANTSVNNEFFRTTGWYSKIELSETPLTSFIRTVLDDATNLAARTTLGVGEGDSPSLTGLTLSGLSASRLAQTNGDKALTSVANLATWVAGTTNEIAIANDGDGSITISLADIVNFGFSV